MEAAAWLMLGGSTLLLVLGLPVALSFCDQPGGAWLFLGGEAAGPVSPATPSGSLRAFR